MTQQSAILHAWADYGVESQALSTYGDVTRATIDPRPNQWSTAIQADGTRLPFPDNTFKIAFGHPLCTAWADTTSISGDPDEHEDYIPETRAELQRVAEHYVIENKPKAPLEDPVVLDARMFGLPIAYERAFETSFPVEQPPRNARLGQSAETSPFFFSERSAEWWRAAKGGIQGDYPKEHLAKNSIPLPYIHHLMRAWMDATKESAGVADYSDYDAEMDERRAKAANQSLEDFAEVANAE